MYKTLKGLTPVLWLLLTLSPAFGQGAPVPDSGSSAPIPGSLSAPPGHSPGSKGYYGSLPLSVVDAQTRIAELRGMLQTNAPPGLQEHVYQIIEWLTDMADAHNKIANSFSKSILTKAQAENERSAARQFVSLKYQAMLLKAEILIKQSRYPEALSPLVDIVAAEPHSLTGLAAYNYLKEIGFSEPVETKVEHKSMTTDTITPEGKKNSTISAAHPVKHPHHLALRSYRTY